MNKIRYFAIMLLLILSCTPALYLPTREQASRAGIPLDHLKQGRQLYIDHCGSCHMLHLPGEFTREKWTAELDSMQGKAKLTAQEKRTILDYLLVGK